MIFKLFIDRNCEEEVIANVHERTPLINEIERLVLQDNMAEQIPGYEEDDITMLDIQSIECFVVENEKTFAVYRDTKRYLTKKRLYEIEEILPGNFERISKLFLGSFLQR